MNHIGYNKQFIKKSTAIRVVAYTVLLSAILFLLDASASQGNDIWPYQIGLSVLVIMIITTDILITKAKNKRSFLFLISIFLIGVNMLCFLDVILSAFSLPGECGSGFSTGNCFMLEGLGMIVYFYSVPAIYIITTTLLITHLVLESRKIVRKKTARKRRNDDPGIL